MRWKLKTLQDDVLGLTGESATYKDITQATGISPNTLSRLANNKIDRVDLATVEKILAYFSEKLGRRLEVGDLLEWAPDRS